MNASSGPSNTSGPTMKLSTTWKTPASACSNTSKPFTIPCVSIRRSATCHPTNSKPFTPRLQRRKPLPRRYPKSWAIAVAYGEPPKLFAKNGGWENRATVAQVARQPRLESQPEAATLTLTCELHRGATVRDPCYRVHGYIRLGGWNLIVLLTA